MRIISRIAATAMAITIAFAFMPFPGTANAASKKSVYVEKATKLIENIIGAFKEFKIDLYDEATDGMNLAICSKFYISYLAKNIGKSEEYYLM